MTDEWAEKLIGDVLDQVHRPVDVSTLVSVPYAGVRWYAEGVYARPEAEAKQVKAKSLNRLSFNDITYNRMWATKAAFGVVGIEAADCLVTNDFPIFQAKETLVPRFLGLIFQSSAFQGEAAMRAVGTTERRRLKEADFLRIPVRLPPLPVQRRIVDLMAHLDNHITNLRAERDGLEEALTIACLEFTAERQGVPVSPISDVAEILDRLRVPISEEVRAGRPGNVPYFGANGQVGWIDQAIFDEPLVLLAEDGGPVSEWRTRPQAYAVDGPSWVNNHAHVLRATAVPRDWLYFSLRHRDLTALAPVGTRSKLTQASLKEIQISLPHDLEEKSQQLRSMEDSVSALEGEIAACRSLRSTVLGAVLSRELAIPEAYDSLLPEVA